ncbi:hypothetical protein Tco_0572734 [Tanacetum coccineum]
MDFREFYKELEAKFWGAIEKLMGLQLLQLELRLGKISSRSFRPVNGSPPCGLWLTLSGLLGSRDGSREQA